MTNFNQAILAQRVRTFAMQSVEQRQAARRMRDLLPMRFNEIRSDHFQLSKSVAKSSRQTYIDERYLDFLDKMLEVQYAAVRNRVQYETHLMLHDLKKM